MENLGKLTMLAALAACLLAGCKSVKYVPVESVRTDSVYITKAVHDSVLVRDSVYIREKGDTVVEYKYREVLRYVDRADTLYVTATDSVQVPYPVEKELSGWQKFKVSFGGYSLAAALIAALAAGWLLYRKLAGR